MYKNWFTTKKPFFGYSKDLLIDISKNPVKGRSEGDFVSVGTGGDIDVLNRLVEYGISQVVAVSTT